MLVCPKCGMPIRMESLACPHCETPVMFDPGLRTMVALDDDAEAGDLAPCANRTMLCNWAVPREGEQHLCFACRITRRRPDGGDPASLDRLAVASQALRRLLVGLADLDLPIVPFWVQQGGLAFDLLDSKGGDQNVVIGQANGVITIDLAESIDAHREAQRVNLGEAYRTMLGHFRHEVGHYYSWQLVEKPGGPVLDECRELFGDERASYQEALDKHYSSGSPAGWANDYISEYATMHPSEDFAETFAHYQHIVATLSTAAEGGLQLVPPPGTHYCNRTIAPRASYADVPFDVVLADWRWVAIFLNRANHSMGKEDLYPFRIPEPVVAKLEFMHRVVIAAHTSKPFVEDVAGIPATLSCTA